MLPTWEFVQIKGAFVGDPNNKDYSILGSPNFGKLPYTCAFLEIRTCAEHV